MKKENNRNFCIAILLLVLFILWTVLVRFVDVQQIGPKGSSVGFAAVNGFIHNLTGVSMFLYTVTDWLGLVPILFALGFAILGLAQWIKRRKITQVDYSILTLGVYFMVVMAVYVAFEVVVINYRPILINGRLEASYPSSTTMLVMCVMPTVIMQFNYRIKKLLLRRFVAFTLYIFTVFMVIARIISGVHWFSDIFGGALLSAGLVMMYYSVIRLICRNNK